MNKDSLENLDSSCKYELKSLNKCIGINEYNMYQDIPDKSIRYDNKLYGLSYSEYLNYMNNYISIDNLNNTSIYIFYVNDSPVGEIGIRNSLNDFYNDKGSQIFYVIRLSQRNKGYGTIMLKYALNECKNLGFKELGINCDDNNISSKKVILKNNGLLKFSYTRIDGGSSSRYIVKL